MQRRTLLSALVLAGLALPLGGSTAGARSLEVAADKAAPRVQVAILLDTSSSMSGLINQAKSELWSIVNHLAEARRGGAPVTIEVALFEYGKSSIPRGEGYVRMISPLTGDLDAISEELFALGTNGGDEYAGLVIQKATQGLQWSKNPRDYRAVFIAGNEPFTQGPVPYQEAIADATRRGIVINTIHCGPGQTGIQGKWAHGAELGGGRYLSINHNAVRLQIASPYDKEIAQLNQKLNRTYVAYGRQGKKRAARQRKQDANAASMGAGVLAKRSATKSGRAYKNSSWDLVDAAEDGEADVAALEEEQLPPKMRKMSVKQRKRYVARKAAERAQLQKRIARLAKKRSAFVAKKRRAKGKEKTLDKAMLDTVNRQMVKRGYKFEK